MTRPNTIAFVPVRGGSKSIPLKNIKLFCEKPLVYWSLLGLEKCQDIDKIILATDSKEIKEVVLSFEFSKVIVYDRLPENASDSSTTESVILEFLNIQNEFKGNDNFILVQATSPLTVSKDYSNALTKMQGNDSIITAVKCLRFFWDHNGNSINYNHNERPRRQDFRGTLMENGAFYISKISSILKSKNRISGKIGIYEMPSYTSYELDEPEDWMIMENLMRIYILNEKKKKIKLFISDVDGVMTDAGMYYSESGDELKKFNTHDGMAFQLLRDANIKTAIITSEKSKIVSNRAKKLKVDFVYQGKKHKGKLDAAKEICQLLNIRIDEVAYIGDDINCFELLNQCGLKACPSNAVSKIKQIPNIICLKSKGGNGVVREFLEYIDH